MEQSLPLFQSCFDCWAYLCYCLAGSLMQGCIDLQSEMSGSGLIPTLSWICPTFGVLSSAVVAGKNPEPQGPTTFGLESKVEWYGYL